ncbi:YIP1 family protein [Sedimentibacter sp. zth1]|uniref:Yip1 family protein n=1 Tax=Sedimentibacter sp. zth1 TaxID=2816908 RepID=UPI001A90E794|nr:Yip1 family protein [Sedimentibacter sp. zth1]QSX05031.1 YIP1 family protein [Sedimentibacter sp. zth1]
MPFCKNCGKEIKDGEICSCQQNCTNDNVVVSVQSDKFDFKKMMKQMLLRFKGALPNNTIEEIKSSTKDNSILWVFVAVVEFLISSLAITVCVRRLLYKFYKTSFGFFGDISYMDFVKEASEIGAGFFSTFFKCLFAGVLSYLVIALLTWLFAKFTKKQISFNCAANMLSTILIPFTAIMILCIVVSFVLPKVALFLMTVGLLSLLILNYIGVKELCGLDDNIFWIYMIYLVIMTAVFSLTLSKIIAPVISNFF